MPFGVWSMGFSVSNLSQTCSIFHKWNSNKSGDKLRLSWRIEPRLPGRMGKRQEALRIDLPKNHLLRFGSNTLGAARADSEAVSSRAGFECRRGRAQMCDRKLTPGPMQPPTAVRRRGGQGRVGVGSGLEAGKDLLDG